MRDRSDRYQIESISALTTPKRLGSYLMEAGLLTQDQINVVLNDQQATGMRFGEIVIARGWLKEQTIEWIMEKVVEPERQETWHQEQILQQRQRSIQPNLQSAPVKTSLPIQPAVKETQPSPVKAHTASPSDMASSKKSFTRREAPISKPLPSVNSSDSNDVNWVG